jgi:hypothetical protein
VVIENGKYKGAETCFPQYGIGIDARTGDALFMDVHELHGNLPMIPIDKDARRLSIVCYLREKVWIRTKGKSIVFMKKHNQNIKNITNSAMTKKRYSKNTKNRTRKT